MTDFLQTPKKLSGKKKRPINKSNRKKSLKETNSKKAIISSSKNPRKKELSVSILVTIKLKPKAEDMDIAIISSDVYGAIFREKRDKVFAISMRNIKYEDKKKIMAETDPKSVVS